VSTVAYTDGACLGNPGPGGWAWAVPDGPFASGAADRTTNQRMEIQAALEAASALPRPLLIISDSTYVVNCFRDGWWVGWEKRGWVNKAKKPVANRDLWEPLIELFKAAEGELRFEWVKGHSGDAMNDLVDRLAVEAATTQRGRTGTGRPADLGPADAPEPRAPSTGGPALPEGHRLLVGGLRPPELGGYDDNPVADGVRRRLVEILRAKAELHPDLLVLTGLGLGAEQLGAEAAAEAGVPYVAALPFPDPDEVWPEASRARFRTLRDGAASVVTHQSRKPTSRQQAGGAIARRDAWLARSAAEALVAWDGHDDRVGKLVRSLVVQLGEEEVWVVEPG
jgi:ribonuclease HI